MDGDNTILARVNGSPITQYELEEAIRSTLGEAIGGKLDAAGRHKVLESLAASRAISQVQEKNLSAEARATLEKKLQARREELLVKEYLKDHAPPEPVTQEMIETYYASHPEQFGAKRMRSYEMMVSSRKLQEAERDALFSALKGGDEKKDWRSWVKELQAQGHPVVFQQGEVAQGLLHPKLQDLMASLKKGEQSRLTLIQGKAYMVRIVEDKELPPRSLDEVRSQIRKRLAHEQLKKAVKKASAQVLKTAEVVYEESE